MEIVINRTKIKDLKIKVVENKVVANAPFDMSDDEVCELISENIDWVNDRISKCTNYYAELFTFKKTLICGETVQVLTTLQTKPYISDKRLYLPEKLCRGKESRRKTLMAFLKMLAATFLSQKVSEIGRNMYACPTKIEIKALKDGWTLCSNPLEKCIVLDFRLIQLPSRLQNFIITHAFVHFMEPNHDAAFTKKMKNYFADYAELERELSKYAVLKEI